MICESLKNRSTGYSVATPYPPCIIMANNASFSAVSVDVTFDRGGFDKLLALILERCCPVGKQTCRVKPHSHLCQLVLDLLKIDQRLFKACPSLRITYGGLVGGLGNPNSLRGHVYASPIICLHANVEPVTLLSHEIVCGDLDVIKDQF